MTTLRTSLRKLWGRVAALGPRGRIIVAAGVVSVAIGASIATASDDDEGAAVLPTVTTERHLEPTTLPPSTEPPDETTTEPVATSEPTTTEATTTTTQAPSTTSTPPPTTAPPVETTEPPEPEPIEPRPPVQCTPTGGPSQPAPSDSERDGRRWVTVGDVAGNCDATSGAFTIRGIDTRLVVRSDADNIVVFVVDAVQGLDASAGFADAQCSGPCSESQTLTLPAGTYYLQVQAGDGPWNVSVQEYRSP
jgi:hypothetical protein